MEAIFKFYDSTGQHKYGEVRCDDSSPRFRNLVASGYSYARSDKDGRSGLNKLDTRGKYEQVAAIE